MTRLIDVASVIRSKNAGPFELALDVFFDNAEQFAAARDSGALGRHALAQLYAVAPDDVLGVYWFEPALAWKGVLRRPVSSGTVGDRDVYGAQQHAPLLALTY